MIQGRLSTNRRHSNLRAGIEESTVSIYEVPSLSTSELLECSHELNLKIKEQDLLRPTEDRVVAIYAVILQMMLPLSDVFGENMDDEQDFTTRVWESMMELFASLDFYDFYQTDLTHPTAARFAKSLSVIMNFAKSRDNSWQGFEQVVSKEEDVLLKSQRIQDENDEVAHENIHRLEKLEGSVPSMTDLDQQLESAQRYLEEEIKAADHLKAEISRVKAIKSAKSAEIKTYQFTLTELANECGELAARAKYDYSDIVQKVKETEQTVEENKVTIEEERQKTDMQDRSIKTLSQAEDSIQLQPRMELRSSRSVLDEWQAKVDKIIQKNDKLLGPVNEIATHNARMKQRLRTMDASITNEKNQRDKKREAMNIFMANLPANDKDTKEEVEKIKQQVMGYRIKSEDLTQEVEGWLQDLEKHKQDTNNKAQSLTKAVASIDDQLDSLEAQLDINDNSTTMISLRS
ncbi:hypothetical protein [Absidia glauca]|uniref:Kinetochore protein Nuf2 N-terminal domain-containing protein n=1 Tax=Absidia glauca TaxID=4829 RepID=A0A168NKY0_ABSGL|nr:hypothetical protein [Absidia glauca]